MRQNLMVNSHFVGGGSQQGGGQLPINLRGQTEYAGVTQLISRWKSTNANLESFTIKKDCISLTVGESRAYFRQLTDPGFEWKQGIYTLSALVRGSGSIFLNIASANTSNSFSGLTAYQLTDQFTICSFSLDTRTISGWDPGQFYMAINAGTTVDIAAMKAEFGEGQTLGYQDSEDSWKLFLQPESDYATQLLECQRYSRIISTKGVDVHLSGFITGNGLYFWAVLPLSVPMRTTPAVTFTGNVTVRTISGYATDNSGSNYLTPKSIEVSADRDNQILTLRFTFDKALGENNTPGTLSLSGSSPGTQIILDANL